MYAFHQQGQSSSVLCTETEKYNNIGKSLKVLRVDENKTSIDRRFNTMITSSN